MNFPATHSPEFIRVQTYPQKTLIFIIIFLVISPNSTNSHSSVSSSDENYSNSSDPFSKFQPSLAVFVGVLSIVFSVTFLILIYAKYCHEPSSIRHENLGNLPRTRSRFSGIDKTIIESLPFFKFSTLKGLKNGLECSVCLSGFEDVEVLRLLPKCKHAFHIDCVDKWLERHSSCPLCRCEVVEDDIALFTYSNSLRFNESERSNVELFIEREGSSRFEKTIKNNTEDQEILHKFNHRIMVCDDRELTMKNRWSNVSSSDLLVLKSEMISCMSSNRFEESSGGGDRKTMNSGEKRSMSEITVHRRFLGGETRGEEERLRRLWLPIARRTVKWFANREKKSAPNHKKPYIINTNSQELLDV